ncbi:MAG: VTT domain-containing protein [Myxococcales bacterium]|nr:VTT domain-containing protein [Myxococcales bacterium]
MRKRLLALLAAVLLLVVAQRLGVFARFSDVARMKETLLGLGGWGYFAFLLTYTLFQPFGLPGTVFVLVAPLIWPWPIAFALSMVGSCTASVAGFVFARFVAREWVAARIPAKFRAYDEALERRAFGTVVTLRFVFWMSPFLHAFFGVSRVSFSTHLWGSAVGYAVPLFLTSFFGQRVFDWLKALPPWGWALGFLGFLAMVWVTWKLRRRPAP